MLKHFFTALILSVAILTVVGCGNSHSPAPVTSKSAASTPAPSKVVFIGDSLTYLWDQPNFGQAEFQTQSEWNDQGIIGQNSSQLLLRFQADVVSQHPAVVHILTGTNDVDSSDSPAWQIDGGSAVFDTTDNIRAMVKMAQDAGIKVVLGTIPPWSCDVFSQCKLATGADPSPVHWQNIAALNQWIRQYGLDNDIPVADYFSAVVSADGETYIPADTFDGVHPSAAGYALWTPLTVRAIQQAEESTQN